MESRHWGRENGYRSLETGDWSLESGERILESGERRLETGDWRGEGEERSMKHGERRVEHGVESGARRVAWGGAFPFCRRWGPPHEDTSTVSRESDEWGAHFYTPSLPLLSARDGVILLRGLDF